MTAILRHQFRAAPVLFRIRVAYKSKLARKKEPSDYALEHFDSFYSKVFGASSWKSIRLALLSQKKFCAVMNPFTFNETIKEQLKDLGAEPLILSESTTKKKTKAPKLEKAEFPDTIEMTPQEEIFEFQDSSRIIKKGNSETLLSFMPATEMVYQEEVVHDEDYFNFLKPETEIIIKKSEPIEFPSLIVYTFPAASIEMFPEPEFGSLNLRDYFLMDGASLLPVVALDIKDNDNFADFCAAPGGKSLSVAFMQKDISHYCMDLSPGRIKRLKRVFGEYLPEEVGSSIRVAQANVETLKDENIYNKILVDAPCSNDRHSLHVDINSIFSPGRIHERLKLPEKQKNILTQALRRLDIGGVCVYSTCSLSPIQNDSVVHMTVQGFKTKRFVVTDLETTFSPVKHLFSISKTRYGQLVLPFLPLNYGPMYISRIERIK